MFDLQAWVDDPLFAFSDEEKVEQLARFSTDDRRKALEGNQLRLSDYSRQMNEGQAKLDALRVAHEQADAKLNRELSEWATVQGASAEKVTAANARIVALEQQKLAARQNIERMAQAQGIDAAPYLEGLDATSADPAAPLPVGTVTPSQPAVESPDLSGLAKTADVATMNQYMFELQTTLPMLQAEHQALTGEPLDTVALGVELQRRAKANESVNPRDVWETLHDIPAKRTAAAATVRTEELAAAESRGREAALSEQAIPTGSPAGTRAIVFQPTRNADGSSGEPRTSALERPQPTDRMAGALQAFATGKYKVAPQGASPGTRPAAGAA